MPNVPINKPKPRLFAFPVLLFVLLLFGVYGYIKSHVSGSTQVDGSERPRNIILMISDGMGPASITMARDYAQAILGRPGLTLDEIQVGAVRTRSANSRVTDSAAGATAYSTGVKTYNGAIAVDTMHQPLGTVLEAAEAEGMATGLIARSRITHATPAAFAAHVHGRDMENEIAAQMMVQGIDVLFGGGLQHFVPSDEGGVRTDGRNLLDEARAQGYHVLMSKEEFMSATSRPVLSLFEGDQAHLVDVLNMLPKDAGDMPPEIDRDTLTFPSLAQMTSKAIELLKDNPKGFFLMIEGSRIDDLAHFNDAAGHLHEILAYDDAVGVAFDFARRDGQTLVVSVSDHETGGLSVHAWKPEALSRVNASRHAIVAAVTKRSVPVRQALYDYAGINDLTEDETAALVTAGGDEEALHSAITDIINHRAGLRWGSASHTAVDVNLYAFGPGRERFIGNHDNTHVGRTIAELLGLELNEVTASLRLSMGSE